VARARWRPKQSRETSKREAQTRACLEAARLPEARGSAARVGTPQEVRDDAALPRPRAQKRIGVRDRVVASILAAESAEAGAIQQARGAGGQYRAWPPAPVSRLRQARHAARAAGVAGRQFAKRCYELPAKRHKSAGMAENSRQQAWQKQSERPGGVCSAAGAERQRGGSRAGGGRWARMRGARRAGGGGAVVGVSGHRSPENGSSMLLQSHDRE